MAAGLKIARFLGEAPKISPELLPETAAQFAYNAKLYSGDLIPYNISSLVGALAKTGVIKTIYPLKDASNNNVFLHWNNDVDVAVSPIPNNAEQRVLYTGDSEPRVTNYALATTGGTGKYPISYYTLGLPTPLVAPTAAAVSFTTLVTVSRARDSGNTATVIFSGAHGLNTGAYLTFTLFADTSFNLSNARVTVINATTVTYFCSGAALGTTADAAGRADIAGNSQVRTYVYTWYTLWGEESTPSPASGNLFLKEGQTVNLSGLPVAWPGGYTGTYQTTGLVLRIYRTVPSTSGSAYFLVGTVPLGTTTFTDNIDVATLTSVLPSLYYNQPPVGMQGILAVQNQFLVGFTGNTVCFSEPGQPHAWPTKYQVQLDAPIVAIGNFGTFIVVTTTAKPWLFQGAVPSIMSKTKMDYYMPNVSKRSLANMGYGVVWATPGGLAVYSPITGGVFLTEHVQDWDTWRGGLDPTTIVGKFYNGKYIGIHSTGGFTFEKDDQTGGSLVELKQSMESMYYDMQKSQLFYAYQGFVYLWDDPTQILGVLDWKSKVMVTKDFMNLGAARVIADFGNAANALAIAQYNVAMKAANALLIAGCITGGAFGRNRQCRTSIAGSMLGSLKTGLSLQFQLFVNKTLITTVQVPSSDIFRLPAGYKSDTFEVRLTGNVHVRAVHLAETPLGLKEV